MSPPDLDQSAWRATTEAELKRLYPDVWPSTIPQREWNRLYILRLSPEQAARQANVYAWNRHTPAERLRQAKEPPRERLVDAVLGEKKPAAPSAKRTLPKPARQERGKRA
jgi:hypothetical protein